MLNQTRFNPVNRGNKQLVWHRLLLVLLITCASFTEVNAAEMTLGYRAAGTINGVAFQGFGTEEQQNFPENNPDVFCALQPGGNKRTPLMAEMNIAYLGKLPLSFNLDTPDGGSPALRAVGSLQSEWGGNVSLYTGSGWQDANYLVAEPISDDYRHGIYLKPSPMGGFLTSNPPFLQAYVACVRTL